MSFFRAGFERTENDLRGDRSSLINPRQGDAILREQLRSSSSRNDSRDLARRLKISQLKEPFKV